MLTYFMYCRKSTEAEDRQILSINSQVSELTRYAKQKRIKIHSVITEAKSAKAPGRPQFNSMMERLYRGEADGIICWKLDRLARNPVDGGAIIWAMKEHEVKIVTPFQMYGQSEDNVVWMYLEFGMAQKYIDDLSKTVKRGLRAKAESGWYPSHVPPGYLNRANDEGRNVVIKDRIRFPLIRKCWELMLTGNYSAAEIRKIANTVWEYKSPRDVPLGRTTLYRIFSNSFYQGIYEYPRGSDMWHIGRHTPMVTKKEFEAVQTIIARSRQLPQNHIVFAFTKLIRCGGCQGMVTAEEKHQLICPVCKFKFAYRSKTHCPKCNIEISAMVHPLKLKYTYYHCARSTDPQCPERGIERTILEKQFVQLLGRICLPGHYRQWMNSYFGRLRNTDDPTEVMSLIVQLFGDSSPTAQRDIVSSVFKTFTLKNRMLTVTLKTPFSFLDQTNATTPLNEESFTQ